MKQTRSTDSAMERLVHAATHYAAALHLPGAKALRAARGCSPSCTPKLHQP